MQIRFLCNCIVKYDNVEFLATTKLIGEDTEGFIVCGIHGQRRYGWRSVPASENHVGPKLPYLSLTPLEVERRLIFREEFPDRKVHIETEGATK